MTTFNRPPINAGCFPAQAAPAGPYDPCAALPELYRALHGLTSGRGTQQVRFGDNWKTFHSGNVVELRKEIARLERLCPASAANPFGSNLMNSPGAVRAGPYSRSSGYGRPYRY